MSNVRVRFAPSPTGFFHVGSARTALFNWLYAKHTGGKFILRIEDTDKERNTNEALNVLLQGMKWLGMDWDEGPNVGGDFGPYFQSQRKAIYDEYLKILEDKGRVYKKEGAIWFKLLGERYIEFDSFHKTEIEKVRNKPVVINDKVRGRVERTEDRDFVIVRSNGEPSFHFVNVVDDITMRITHVIRGEDHLSNTSKHIELYKAFGVDIPIFAHIPLILKESGSGKMSKRDKGALIDEYEKRLFISEAIINYISLLGWSPKDDTDKMSVETIIERFDFPGINKGNARFDRAKLMALNGEYIKALPKKRLIELALPILKESNLVDATTDLEYLSRVLVLCQEKVKSIETIVDFTTYFFQDSYEFEPKALQRILKGDEANAIFSELLLVFEKTKSFEASEIEMGLRTIAEQSNRKIFTYFPLIRMAVSGRTGGPDLLPMLEVMGKDRVLTRLQSFAEKF